MVIQDHQAFRRKKWKYLILDEVLLTIAFHFLKNHLGVVLAWSLDNVYKWTDMSMCRLLLYPRFPKGEGGIMFYLCPSFRPSKIFFIAFFSVTVDGRNVIFGHKRHIGIPYCGLRFWTHQIPTSCLPILLIFIHI